MYVSNFMIVLRPEKTALGDYAFYSVRLVFFIFLFFSFLFVLVEVKDSDRKPWAKREFSYL